MLCSCYCVIELCFMELYQVTLSHWLSGMFLCFNFIQAFKEYNLVAGSIPGSFTKSSHHIYTVLQKCYNIYTENSFISDSICLSIISLLFTPSLDYN